MDSSRFHVILVLCVVAPPFLVFTVKEQSRRQQIMSLRPYELPGTVTLFHTTNFCGCDSVLGAAKTLQQLGFRIKLVNVDTHQHEAQLNNIESTPTYVYYKDGKEQNRVRGRLYERQLEKFARDLR